MRTVPAVILLVALLAMLAMVGGAAPTDDPAATNESMPGERVAAGMIVSDAELEGELEGRAFGHAIAAAETDEERAALIAERIEQNQDRLKALEERRAHLEAEREAGNLTPAQYQAAKAATTIESATIEETAAQSAAAAPGLEDQLREQGVTVEEIETLRENAADMDGPKMADLVGGEPGGVSDGEPGPPDDTPANSSASDY